MKKQVAVFAAVIGWGMVMAEVGAITITPFTDRPSFETAMVGITLTLEDFTGTSHFPISTGVLNSATNLPGIGILPGDIQPGVTYSVQQIINDPTVNFFNIDSDPSYVGGFLDGRVTDPNTQERVLDIVFDQSVMGFGFDANESFMGTDVDVTIGFSSGPDAVVSFMLSQGDTLQFIGVKSDLNDIVSATIDGMGGVRPEVTFALDNFTFGGSDAVVAVPEPVTTMLGLIGLATLAIANRRRV